MQLNEEPDWWREDVRFQRSLHLLGLTVERLTTAGQRVAPEDGLDNYLTNESHYHANYFYNNITSIIEMQVSMLPP